MSYDQRFNHWFRDKAKQKEADVIRLPLWHSPSQGGGAHRICLLRSTWFSEEIALPECRDAISSIKQPITTSFGS